tara:strand:+ start:664 stop:864 length:201 start_codon:yes stop_codon:yes gene_type:complete
MHGNQHDWNILIVEKFSYPRKSQKEFQVSSPSALGAIMKANKIIKKEYSGWEVKSVWYLNPDQLKR